MSESPRYLAELIVEGKEAWADRDAVTVCEAYLELLSEVEDYILWAWHEAGHAAAHARLIAVARKSVTPVVTYAVSDRDALRAADQADIQVREK